MIQKDEELWSVSQDATDLYCYPTEDKARSAALALANQATNARVGIGGDRTSRRGRRQFTGIAAPQPCSPAGEELMVFYALNIR
jgi:hypothetical protein